MFQYCIFFSDKALLHSFVQSVYSYSSLKASLIYKLLSKFTVENRQVLRENDAITRLLDVLAQPTLNDLHVMVVMVLSNLLEDTESLEVLSRMTVKSYVSFVWKRTSLSFKSV